MSKVTLATSLLRRITSRCTSSQFSQVRHVKKKQREIDEDFSWAAPIIERHLAQREGKLEEEKPISKLHMVLRLKTLIGRPYWEKEMCEKYGLHEKEFKKVILKNTPSINKDLQTISHLIQITPITFPYGLPESEEDYEHCQLQDNGEFIVKKKLNPVSDGEIKIDKEPKESVWEMDIDELKRHSRKKLDNWDLNSEYFEPEYVYEHNQDGKEYRYFGDKSMGGKRKGWY